jgi:hypothetical protein
VNIPEADRDPMPSVHLYDPDRQLLFAISLRILPFETMTSDLAVFIAPVTVEARALFQKEGHGLRVLPQRR